MTLRVLGALFILCLALGSASQHAHAQERVRRNVQVDWDPVEGASLYEVKIYRKDKGPKHSLEFKLKSSSWSANVKPGIYSMKIRSYDSRGVPGEWSPESDLLVKLPAIIVKSPKEDSTLNATDADKQPLIFEWEKIPDADHYKIQVKATTGDWHTEEETKDPKISLDLPSGNSFQWNVIPVDAENRDGEISSQPYKFDLVGPPLDKPSINRPLSKYVQELSWRPTSHADSYSYALQNFDAKSKRWLTLEKRDAFKGETLSLDISRPSGLYRLNLQAKARERHSSAISRMEFQTRGGFRDPAALQREMLRDSLYKPTRFYAIASYLITRVTYSGTDYDVFSHSSFHALGGTGRLGLGFQDPDSKWGGFGIVDLSGFIINGSNFKFASVEGHLTRKLEFGQQGILLLGTGLFSKELPIVQGTELSGFEGVGKVRMFGPHLGFTYWLPLTQRFGLQANARAYYTLLGTAPNSRSVKPSLSYQYGLLGSYRLSRNWMSYAGYAFRQDEARYESQPGTNSFAQDGQINNVQILGDYFNVILEFSF